MSVRRRASGRVHYNYFRDYDPALGRYVESDPIGLQGGLATYSYVSGDPLAMIDPSAESPAAVILGLRLYCMRFPRQCVAAAVALEESMRHIMNKIIQCWDNPGEGWRPTTDKPCQLVISANLGPVPEVRPNYVSRVCIYQCADGSYFSRSLTNALGCPQQLTKNSKRDPGINPDSGPAGP